MKRMPVIFNILVAVAAGTWLIVSCGGGGGGSDGDGNGNGNGTPNVKQDLVLTEIVVTPTAGEFVELHNSTGTSIDLSDHYLTDATFAGGGTFYYNIVTGANAGGGGFGDFHARFPDGATIAPGEYQTVSLAGSDDFFSDYGVDPTYELFEDGVTVDSVPDMREALPGSIVDQGTLTNSGEVVILYHWDGSSDLVSDVDYFVWGDKVEAVDKTGVAIDGPDGDAVTSTYMDDTAIASQDVVSTVAHIFGTSWQRTDLTEGSEVQEGGGGLYGHDETSENLSATWSTASPTPNTSIQEMNKTLLFSEIVVTPTAGEFVELYNPKNVSVDLSNYYLTDATFAGAGTFYYNIVTGVNAGGGSFGDFHARFPGGATIAPGEYQTVSLKGSGSFFTTYGVDPTYELYEDGVSADAVPDMREAFFESINSQGSLLGSGEVVILYYWDGSSDLVSDIDYVVWGDKAEAVDKTGVALDGPDGDAVASTYQADTATSLQDAVAQASHALSVSWQRTDLTEGSETPEGGNGPFGNDETSENLSATWSTASPTPNTAVP